ncbi:Methylated-DNA-protein-cysteinemethyltransferase [Methanoculleus chikugoensis]|jgi:methylated-DNA-[protein]-cysteine S-methyltransferase|uniref:Methylated-DNA-protein-cysteinemethyltransferase n=1 Tax=Methanoculleus chikugoensis TaxID=118126 RepID=A0A1M4MJP9_9EURY|nr:methylated-DNA--[protein]-cysteine S-methyltransferase [Methanoculleus chikugoensis]MDD4567626.1 methylated-DNA--[protein]-cysteine S-methyltransferase [Methanoculleus chikugoensis]NMA09457.1 methylated-DNA--[protein]-cysteine S-methyltransferase [Methanomicrobiales archaeon]SCL75050.1 Methylated-DNA-protein-cysteinemethyltransferase [Methanoculleus chikugoensis]
MAILNGSCRLDLWYVHVAWQDDLVYRVRFAREGIAGSVPEEILRYCAGRPADLSSLRSIATEGETTFAKIYRAVRAIPCGETVTYGEVARMVGTAPRAVGAAMARNPTPIVVPCHRVVAKAGIGGFSPDLAIKETLLALERRGDVCTLEKRGVNR